MQLKIIEVKAFSDNISVKQVLSILILICFCTFDCKNDTEYWKEYPLQYQILESFNYYEMQDFKKTNSVPINLGSSILDSSLLDKNKHAE